MATQFLHVKDGTLAYDDTGAGPLVICVPGMGDLRGEYRFLAPKLDALDAYNQKLVKKIAVRGISVKGLAGTNAYLYLQSIEVSTKKPPEARVEFEQKLKSGEIKRVVRKLSKGDNLFDLSDGLDQYRLTKKLSVAAHGFSKSAIDKIEG